MPATDPTSLTLEPFSDPESLRLYLLKIDDSTQLSDAAATLLIAEASAVIREYCGWHIAGSKSMTVEVLATGGQDLYLPTKWLTDVSEMRIGREGAWIAIDPARYQWFADGIVNIAEGFVFPRSRFNTYGFPYLDPYYTYTGGILLPKVELDITHGYAATPASVTAACNMIAALAGANPSGIQSESRTVGLNSTSTRFGTRLVAGGYDVDSAASLLSAFALKGLEP